MNEQRKKLSKRRDDVSVGDYIDRGYLPEAMVNYLAVLGWGPPDGAEIRPFPEIVDLFRLDDVNKAGAFFDLKKLDHFNGEYIRALPTEEFVSRSTRWLFDDPPWPPERFDATVFERMAPLVQERVTTLSEAPGYVDFLFLADPVIDDGVVAEGRGQGSFGGGGPARCRARGVPDVRMGAHRAHGRDQGRR